MKVGVLCCLPGCCSGIFILFLFHSHSSSVLLGLQTCLFCSICGLLFLISMLDFSNECHICDDPTASFVLDSMATLHSLLCPSSYCMIPACFSPATIARCES